MGSRIYTGSSALCDETNIFDRAWYQGRDEKYNGTGNRTGTRTNTSLAPVLGLGPYDIQDQDWTGTKTKKPLQKDGLTYTQLNTLGR